MIIFLYGPDDYRREEKKRSLIEEFKKKHSAFGFSCFDLSVEEKGTDFENFCRNQSIFEKSKLAVLISAFSPAGGENAAKEVMGTVKKYESDPATTIIISEKENAPKVFDFLAKKPTGKKKMGILTQKFDFLDGPAWADFINTEAEKRGVKLTDSAAQFLSSVYKNDTWRLITELQKLSSWGKTAMDKKDLEKLEMELAPNFWQMINGIKSKYMADRFTVLEKLFGTHEPAGKIFNILAYQLPEKLQAMADYDLAVKSGKMDYEEALVDLAL